MSKQCVLISVRPQWCELIANGKKTIEVRKSRPKLETPFKCYIYCTQDKEHTLFKDWIDPPFVTKEYNIMNGKGVKNVFADHRPWGNANGKVIGEFVCDHITNLFTNSRFWLDEKAVEQTCLTGEQIREYANGKDAYGWHISALQIYDKPRELGEFKKYNRQCYYGDLGLATPKCKDCKTCQLTRPPESWAYVEGL